MKAIEDKNCVKTFRKLGINEGDMTYFDLEISNYSEPTEEENRKINAYADNRAVCTLNKRDPGESTYITGELQFFESSVFRLHCRKMKTLYNREVKIFGFFPDIQNLYKKISTNNKTLEHELLQWWHNKWSKLDWIHRLDILYILGTPILKLWGYETPEENLVHSWVLGNEFIYLQEEHFHGEPKRIWVLSSKNGVERYLNQKIIKEKKKQTGYLSHIFTRKLFSIKSPSSTEFLILLYDNKKMYRKEFDSMNREFHKSLKIPIADLEAIGFIQDIDNRFQITRLGEEYAKFLLSEEEGQLYE